MATNNVQINITYATQVNNALAGGRAVLAQLQQINDRSYESNVLTQKQNSLIEHQIKQMERLTKVVIHFGQRGGAAMKQVTTSTREWGLEMTRTGVFLNKTLASISGATQSLGGVIRDAFGVSGSGIKSLSAGTSTLISDFSKQFANFIGTGGIIQQIGRVVSVGARAFISTGSKIGELLIQGIGTTLGSVPKILGELTKVTGAISGAFGGLITQAFKGPGLFVGLLTSGITNAAGAIQKAFGSVLGGLGDLAAKIFGGIGEIAAQAVGGIVEIVSAAADRVAAILGSVGETLGKTFGVAIAAGAAIAIPLGFASAEFREGLSAAYGVVVGEVTEKEFDKLVEGSKQVAIRVGTALNQVPQALFKAVSPGFTTQEQTLKDLEAAAKLAAIGNVQLLTSIDTANIVLDAYGRNLETVESVSVKLFNSTRLGRLEIEELTNTLGLISGIAANAGIPLNDLLTTINLAQRTLPASRAITGLANSIGKLQNPAAETKREFKEFFDAIENGAGGIISFRKVFEELDRLGIFKDPTKLRKIFPDERGIRGITAAMTQFVNSVGLYDEVLGTIVDGSSAFEQVSERALTTVFRSFARLFGQVRSIADTLLEKLRPAIVSAFGEFGKLLSRVQDAAENLNTSFVTGLTESVVRFIRTVPERLSDVVDFFSLVASKVKTASQAIKEFLDDQLNLSQALNSLFSGELTEAFDLLFGSKAIETARSFFREVVTEITGVANLVGKIFQGVTEFGRSFIESTVNNNPLLSIGAKAFSGGVSADPLKLIVQAALGVDPIQGASSLVASTAKGAAIGAGGLGLLGAGVGLLGGPFAPITVPAGAAIFGGVGAVGGGGVGFLSQKHENDQKREGIDQAFEYIRKTIEEDKKLAAERRVLSSDINKAFEFTSNAYNELNAIQSEANAVERERLNKLKLITAIRTQVEAEFNTATQKILELEKEAGIKGEEGIRALADRKATEEIAKREADRNAQLVERERLIREKVIENLRETNAILEEARAEYSAMVERTVITRGVTAPIAPGRAGALIPGTRVSSSSALSTRNFLGSSRFTDTIGSAAETDLVTALKDLIDALKLNTEAQKAVTESLRPFNLDENLKGLNTRARVSIRRSKEDRQRALAEGINSRFESTGLPDAFNGFGQSSLFGFGDSGPGGNFASIIRALTFGGTQGYGISQPGESGLSRTAFAETITTALRGDIFGFLSPLRRNNLDATRPGEPFIDASDLIPGAPSARRRIAGGKGRGADPFGGASESLIESLRALIRTLADTAFAGDSRFTGKEALGELAAASAEELGLSKEALRTNEGQLALLQLVADKLDQLIAEDKDTLERSKKSKEVEEAREKVATIERDRADLAAKAFDAPRKAAEGIPEVPADAIRKSFLEKEIAGFDKLVGEQAKAAEELAKLETESAKLNEAAIAKFTELGAKFSEVLESAQKGTIILGEKMFNATLRNVELAEQYTESVKKLTSKIDEISKRQANLSLSIENVRKGKSQ